MIVTKTDKLRQKKQKRNPPNGQYAYEEDFFMRFIEWLKDVYTEERILAVTLIIVAVALLIFTLIAYMVRAESIFTSFFAVLCGGLGIMVACYDVGEIAAWVSVCLCLVLGGVLYLLLFSALRLRKMAAERKKRRAEISRRLQYTLPDRGNGYIRERLKTALKVDDAPENEEENKVSVRLGYARALLCKVQEAPLTVAERLQTEEIGKIFTLYKGKEGWKTEELRNLNDLCATLLKLSAKYAV